MLFRKTIFELEKRQVDGSGEELSCRKEVEEGATSRIPA